MRRPSAPRTSGSAETALFIRFIKAPAGCPSFDQRYQVSGIAAGTVMNRTYTHDGAGNVKTISGITKPPIAPGTTDYSIPSGGNRVSGSTGKTVKTYTYDNAGKITSDGVRTFIYNQNGQLIRVTAGSTVIAEYAYDAFSRRVKKTAGGSTVLYHYDYDGNLISETDGAGNPLRDYVHLNGEPVTMKIYGTGAGWYWFLNDHLGTPQKIVDASGTVVWEAGYMPFGEARVLVADVENNLRFPGQYYDSETGFHYNWHRYYDPDTGRYLTPDPIGLEGGMNLYVYVNGNPVNIIDPFGLSKTKGIKGGKTSDEYYHQLIKAKGDRNKIIEIEKKILKEKAEGNISKIRWNKLKAWIKTAKDGRLYKGMGIGIGAFDTYTTICSQYPEDCIRMFGDDDLIEELFGNEENEDNECGNE